MSSPAYDRVVETVGRRVTSGDLSPGAVMTSEALERDTGASRSVVREAIRSLTTMGLVEVRRRVGVTVLPPSAWNLFAPRVIRWRLQSEDAAAQVAALCEMRLAVEPEAARLAATRTTAELAGRLVSAAGVLWAGGAELPAADAETFAVYDADFHRLLLEASGNPMFVQLAAIVSEALRERAEQRPLLHPVDVDELQLHVDLAHHVQRGRADEAWVTAREIVVRGDQHPHP